MTRRTSTDAIVENALKIARSYKKQGLTLTLRQMYYQFVARGLCPNGQKYYDRIGIALTNARYDGRFPIEWLEDRGRSVDPGDYGTDQTDVGDMLDEAGKKISALPSSLLWRSRWFNQPHHVSVWVEKEAMAGVFEPVCNELGVSWFACKGYPSVSALYEWLKHTNEAYAESPFENCRVLYFGDHDPDGWEIPRSSERNVERLRLLERAQEAGAMANAEGLETKTEEWAEYVNERADELQYDAYQIDFKRVALNMNQIKQFNPPPFPAKETSARYKKYIAEHDTDDAWELDALEPATLRQLIRDEVNALFDVEVYNENKALVEERRESMRTAMKEEGWFESVISNGGAK